MTVPSGNGNIHISFSQTYFTKQKTKQMLYKKQLFFIKWETLHSIFLTES